MPSPFLRPNFLWKILFPLQGFAVPDRFIGVRQNTKAGMPQKQECGAGGPNI